MQVLEAIETRSSAKKYTDAVPSREQVEAVLRAAVRAPDHGLLAPWRFAVMQGESRALLGDAMAAALRERTPEADAETLERERSKAFRSPVLIAVAASPKRPCTAARSASPAAANDAPAALVAPSAS